MNSPLNEHPKKRGMHVNLSRMARLALKELRESLRDRRTILTLLVMPLLVYPLLSVVFQKFLFTSFQPPGDPIYLIAVESEEARGIVERHLGVGELSLLDTEKRELQPDSSFTDTKSLKRKTASKDTGWQKTPKTKSDNWMFQGEKTSLFKVKVVKNLEDAVQDGSYDLGIRILRKTKLPTAFNFEYRTEFELVHRERSPLSAEAMQAVKRAMYALNNEVRVALSSRRGISRHAIPVKIIPRAIVGTGTSSPYSLAALIPLILILMTITGAVYPAIDLTAGERERGTLEMLVAAPVPRLGLLLAKYAAVLLVAMLTASVNLIGMSVTILATGLGPILFGEEGLSLFIVVSVFGLMLLFAAFFSAVLLVLTSFARSFKEAQAYLIPLMLVSIAPGILSMVPDLSLNGLLAVTPLANIVLLARDIFSRNVDPVAATVVVVSTVFYAMAALAVAAKIFGTDAILYGSHGSWSDFFRRQTKPATAISISGAMMCLAMLFPGSILLGQLAARATGLLISGRLLLTGIMTIILFGGIPFAVATYRRVDFTAGFSLRRPKMISIPGAILLGLSLWPFVFEVVVLSMEWGMAEIRPEVQELSRNLLADLQTVSPVIVLMSLAIIPGIFEEFFFRGFLLSALRSQLSDKKAILISGMLFGLFHVVVRDALAVERFLPSALLGLILGWICVRTGSLYPGIILHTIHNGFLLIVAFYERELAEWNIGMEEKSHLPIVWLIGATFVAGVGFFLIRLARADDIKSEQTL